MQNSHKVWPRVGFFHVNPGQCKTGAGLCYIPGTLHHTLHDTLPVYSVQQYITPPSVGFPRTIARQPRGCQYRPIRLRKFLGEMFPPPTFLAPTLLQHSVCGDIDHGRSARRGVIYIVLYGTPHHTTPHYTTLHHTTLHYTTLHYTTLHYTTHYTTLHYTTLLYFTLLYCTLHYTTLLYLSLIHI